MSYNPTRILLGSYEDPTQDYCESWAGATTSSATDKIAIAAGTAATTAAATTAGTPATTAAAITAVKLCVPHPFS